MNWDFGERFWGVYRRMNPIAVIFGGLFLFAAIGAAAFLVLDVAIGWLAALVRGAA